MKLVLIGLFAVMFVACSASSSPDIGNDGTSQPDRPSLHVPPMAENSDAQSARSTAMGRRCGGAELQLRCPAVGDKPDMLDCRQTSLTLKNSDGHFSDLEKPSEMSNYTAVGLGCAVAKDGSAYFVVQYGELPFGCQFCEWNYLYDQNGRQLSHSLPAVLRDASLPGDDKQYPNNQEFEALQTQLGLSQTEVEFLTCDVRVDAGGEPACQKESRDARQ